MTPGAIKKLSIDNKRLKVDNFLLAGFETGLKVKFEPKQNDYNKNCIFSGEGNVFVFTPTLMNNLYNNTKEARVVAWRSGGRWVEGHFNSWY